MLLIDKEIRMPGDENKVQAAELDSLFHECRQCGACCKRYRKVLLKPEEAEFIQKMGGYVGFGLSLDALRNNSLEELSKQAAAQGKLYMIHPDQTGCVFLEKRNDKYFCKIYHYRPESCRGFRCNLADGSLQNIFGTDAMHLLGKDRFGLPLKTIP